MKTKFIICGLLLSLLFFVSGCCDGTQVVYEIPQENKQKAEEFVKHMCEEERVYLSTAISESLELYGVVVYTVKHGEIVEGSDRRVSIDTSVKESIVNVSPQSNTVSIDNRDYENEIRNLETELTLLKAKIQALESRDNNNDSYNWRRQ